MQKLRKQIMTALAAILEVLVIGAGHWWADAVMALYISISVVKDGYSHLRTSLLPLGPGCRSTSSGTRAGVFWGNLYYTRNQ